MGLAIVLAATLGASSLTGCGASSKTDFSLSYVENPEPLERLVVFLSIPANGFDRGIYYGFQSAMTSKLAACGVSSKIFPGDPPEPDDSPESYLGPDQ